MKRLLLIVIIAYFPTLSFAESAASQELAALLHKVTAMTAYFRQITQNNRGAIVQKATGLMAMQRPGKFRWQIKGNTSQLIIADGKRFWVYDKDLDQVTVQTLNPKQEGLPALLLTGSIAYLNKHFQITKLTSTSGRQQFKLTAQKDKQATFKYVELKFDGKKLVLMKFVDNLEQTTRIVFNRIVINPKLKASVFKFTPPKGADVIQASLVM